MAMNRTDLLRLLERTLRLAPNTLTGTERLRDVPGFDSMSTLLVIAMIDKHCGKPVPASSIARCETVDEVLNLADQQRAAA